MADCTPITQVVVDGNGTDQNFPAPPADLTPIGINVSTGISTTLQAATAGYLTRLYRLFLVADGACSLTFFDGATALDPVIKMAAGETVILDQGLFPWFQGTPDTDFKFQTSAAVQITGCAWINLNPA
jgi:hypothetical protein